ncbi:MAG: redoxin domain-containing protein [bacterium]|nr:redoxin domain-containing protein [bacterium]
MAMQKVMRTICVSVLAAMILFASGCNRSETEADSGTNTASDPRAQTEFLKSHKLLGKPALIEFGMVGCELSHSGFQSMIQLHSNDLVEGLVYARVELSRDSDAVDQYYRATPAGFPVERDPDRKIANAFDATVLPVFILVDKFGNIRYKGGFPAESLGDWSKMLLAEKTDPGPSVARLGVKTINAKELLATTKLPELGGSDQTLADYAGPAGVMLVFADANCPYSGQALKDLPSVSLVLKKRKIPTVVVNITDPEKMVKAYYAKLNLGLPVVYDTGSAVRIGWDIQSVPTIMLFDAQLQVAYNGPAVWADVGRAGEKAMGLPPGALNFKAKGTGFG